MIVTERKAYRETLTRTPIRRPHTVTMGSKDTSLALTHLVVLVTLAMLVEGSILGPRMKYSKSSSVQRTFSIYSRRTVCLMLTEGLGDLLAKRVLIRRAINVIEQHIRIEIIHIILFMRII